MRTTKITLLIIIGFLTTACHNDSNVSTELQDSGYDAALFSPSPQFKNHLVAAFVVPTDQASMSFQVSGIIEEQFIYIGDSVVKGQELFKVSNPSLAPQINQFKSEIEAIEATLKQNQVEVRRFKNLKQTNAISQNELDRLTNQRDNLLASKKSLEAQLEQAESLFDESYLRAPFAGNIAEIYKEAGEVISPGEVILVVGGITSLEAPIFLPAFLHKNLRQGDILEVLYDQNPIQATIKEISQTANPSSQLFKVMLDVPIMHGIKSGEKITVQIPEEIGEFFRLPIESVIDDGINQPFVFVIDNNQVIQSKISLIDIEGDEVIVKMPQQGEVEVVTAGQSKLSPQQKLIQP
ncbi:efflux RND transporter periplasmic adaptor subunit [Marinicella sp. S1101]|uniref:efflux RND transporter periplasmic adaptor subunit n=1 Tax=Marinicella marina TaxID=2996016 RepID=UPI002260FF95|nr:efflux RND transporter periplasmic adaptor subunit [Marinicella marina]MCX7553428.1 efflux RND transporter periplasmic adaptor subunit [Marinicella marina]MDJ1140052.1 efflux RND transporter periplasmic adaptor subunit [Marinicella marina]